MVVITMNLEHLKKKKTLKIVGFVLLGIGVVLSAIGLISFFSAFNSQGAKSPDLFWCCFIGFPLIGAGGGLLTFAFRREIAKYSKDETMPVAKEAYQDLHPEIKDFVGMVKDGSQKKIQCPKCGAMNDTDHKFCNSCGEPISNLTCPHCGESVEANDHFCPHCGKEITK